MKTARQKRYLWLTFAGFLCSVLLFTIGGLGRFLGSRSLDRARANRAAAAALPPKTTKVFFTGGLGCAGQEHALPALAWQITCLSQRLVVTSDSPPSVELPLDLMGDDPLRLAVCVPGWNPTILTLPPAAENGCFYIRDPVVLSREMACFALAMPTVGTDYDFAEVAWLRPLDNEPLATASGAPALIPLDFNGMKRLAPLPSGVYTCTLKGRGAARIRDFHLRPELALRPNKDQSLSSSVSLPPSLSRTYIGFAGSAADSQQSGGSTGFFCGVSINLRKNGGELLLAFRPLENEQSLRYADLKPRPDTFWPISNLFLQDPVSLAFDCPLSYVDYRMVLHAADGRFTLLPELVPPEDGGQQRELLERMRALIRAQAHSAAGNPGSFDSRYARLPVEQLPNFENLLSPNHFARHLARLSRTPATMIELGSQITVQREGQSSWDTHIRSAYSDPADF